MRIEITSEVRCVLLLPNHVAPRAEGSPDGLEPLRQEAVPLCNCDRDFGIRDQDEAHVSFTTVTLVHDVVLRPFWGQGAVANYGQVN